MWPARAKSSVVIALAHKEDELELDWWENRVVSAGGRIMARIVDALAEWEERVEALKDILPVSPPFTTTIDIQILYFTGVRSIKS